MAIELQEWFRPGSSRLSLHSASSGEQAEPPPRKARFQSGWRFGLYAGAASCTVVFAVNLSATIWALTRKERNRIGQPILREGVCADMRNLNTGLHLMINVLSSILLAASNFGMQCISAPTRADVDKAHFEGKWMDIGVPSVHNLRRLPRKRVVLWGLLMLSSLPLHLVYNSVVFSSLGTVGYEIWTAESAGQDLGQSKFFDRTWNITQNGHPLSDLKDDDFSDLRGDLEMNWANLTALGASNKLERLDNLKCIRQYATSFQTSRQSVILVMAARQDGGSKVQADFRESIRNEARRVEHLYQWVCGDYMCHFQKDNTETTCRNKLPALEKAADDWSPYCEKVEYCYSQPVEEKCQLTFGPSFMVFVLASNALKAAILLYVALRPPEESLFVLGDAVESFLTVPDAFSIDSCLASVDQIKRKGSRPWTGPRTWAPVKRRWTAAVSRRRWRVSILLQVFPSISPTYSISLLLVLFFLILGLVELTGGNDLASLWRLGFGTVTELTLIKAKERTVADSFSMTESVLLANLPHFVFSGLYFQYNALFTAMLAANEWSDFGRKRKGLRVSSDPKGEQRARYFLQLPYRWSIPLILMSMLIHWMLSQSIFIVPIEFDEEFATTCGYSPIAIIAVILAAALMALAVVLSGYRRLPTAMPVVGSCSLGIAAACHGPGGAERPDEALATLRWGAMTQPEEGSGVDEIGHCGFSGDFVEEPRVDAKYA